MSIDKEDEKEDEKFGLLLQDRRHKEIYGSLKSISEALSNKDELLVVEAIVNQSRKLEGLIEAIQNMGHKPSEVNVEVNQDRVIETLNKICNEIISSNERLILSLDNRLLPDTFELLKNGFTGATHSVKVNYKSAKNIN